MNTEYTNGYNAGLEAARNQQNCWDNGVYETWEGGCNGCPHRSECFPEAVQYEQRRIHYTQYPAGPVGAVQNVSLQPGHDDQRRVV